MFNAENVDSIVLNLLQFYSSITCFTLKYLSEYFILSL